MSRFRRVADLYTASAQLSANDASVSLVIVADPLGAILDRRMQELARLELGEEVPLVDELLAIGRLVRWRNLVQPTPARFDHDVDAFRESITTLRFRISAMLDPESGAVTESLATAALDALAARHTPAAGLLLDSLREVDGEGCIVVAQSAGAQQRIALWIAEEGFVVPVHSVGSLMAADVHETGYFVGPPTLFGSRVVAAPRCVEMTFILPSWCRDRSVPHSAMSGYATGALRPKAHVFTVGDEPEPELEAIAIDPIVPQAIWLRHNTGSAVGPDEVLAREVYLAGGMMIYLDKDGDSIRTLDPDEPPGHRVELRPVPAISVGSVLVLRHGETESAALLRLAFQELGPAADTIRARQESWKSALTAKLDSTGSTEASRQLRELGVSAAGQVRAWVALTVVRPRMDLDFRLLLTWLGLADAAYWDPALQLRRARMRAVKRVTKALEDSLAQADMARLSADGVITVELGIEGFAAMTAARVLAISPTETAVHHHDVRIPQSRGVKQWLE